MHEISILQSYFDMVQHELFLCVVQGAVRAFEHWDFMVGNMLVEVCAEQGLQTEHSVTHGALVDQPEKYTQKCTMNCTARLNWYIHTERSVRRIPAVTWVVTVTLTFEIWAPNLNHLPLNWSESLCQIWRDSLIWILRYHVHKNGMVGLDGQMDEGWTDRGTTQKRNASGPWLLPT